MFARLTTAFFTGFEADFTLFLDDALELDLTLVFDLDSLFEVDLPHGVFSFLVFVAAGDLVLAGCLTTFFSATFVVLDFEIAALVGFFAEVAGFLGADVFFVAACLVVDDLLTVLAGAYLDFEVLGLEDAVFFGADVFGAVAFAAGLEVADLLAGDFEAFFAGAFLGFEAALEALGFGSTLALEALFFADTEAYSSESMATPSTIFGIGSEWFDSDSD